jgi:hypothetical protein
MGFKISELFPKGGDEQIYITTIVNLNNTYEWGLPINISMSWAEIEEYLNWIDAITSHLKFTEIYQYIPLVLIDKIIIDSGVVIDETSTPGQLFSEIYNKVAITLDTKIVTDNEALFEITTL